MGPFWNLFDRLRKTAKNADEAAEPRSAGTSDWLMPSSNNGFQAADFHASQFSGEINDLNSKLGSVIAQIRSEMASNWQTDIWSALAELDTSERATDVIRAATNQACLDLGYGDVRSIHLSIDQNRLLLSRLRSVLVEWGYDPAEIGLAFQGSEPPRSLSELKLVLAKAEKGSAQDQYLYARAQYDGIGGSRNITKAATWFRKAADQGHAGAQFFMGVLHDSGLGVERNPSLARQWFRRAAEQGDADAQANLGLMCITGEGGPLDRTGGVRWLKKAAAAGQMNGQYQLAGCYDRGEGVEKNPQKSFELYLNVASRSEFDPLVLSAQYNVGLCYFKGDGVARDPDKALSWFKRAAYRGHTGAQEVLSQLGIA